MVGELPIVVTRSFLTSLVEDFLMDPSRFSVVEESEKFGLVEHLPDIGELHNHKRSPEICACVCT